MFPNDTGVPITRVRGGCDTGGPVTSRAKGRGGVGVPLMAQGKGDIGVPITATDE